MGHGPDSSSVDGLRSDISRVGQKRLGTVSVSDGHPYLRYEVKTVGHRTSPIFPDTVTSSQYTACLILHVFSLTEVGRRLLTARTNTDVDVITNAGGASAGAACTLGISEVHNFGGMCAENQPRIGLTISKTTLPRVQLFSFRARK